MKDQILTVYFFFFWRKSNVWVILNTVEMFIICSPQIPSWRRHFKGDVLLWFLQCQTMFSNLATEKVTPFSVNIPLDGDIDDKDPQRVFFLDTCTSLCMATPSYWVCSVVSPTLLNVAWVCFSRACQDINTEANDLVSIPAQDDFYGRFLPTSLRLHCTAGLCAHCDSWRAS